MEINFDTKKLRFLKRDDAISGDGIPLVFDSQGIPGVVCKFAEPGKTARESTETEKPIPADDDVQFVIDTGFTECLGLTGALFEKMVQRGAIRPLGFHAGANFQGGMGVMRLGRLHRLTLGKFSVDNLTVVNLGNAELNLIGTQFLSRFHVTFAFPVREMYLAPGKRFRELDLTGIQSFGVSFPPANFVRQRGAHLTVVTTDPDGPAKKAGLKEADVIERIDGQEFEEKSLFQINRSFEKPGQKLELRIRRGEQRHDITIPIPKEPAGLFVVE